MMEDGEENNEMQRKKDELSPDSAYVIYFSLNEQGAYTRYIVSKPLNYFQEYDVAKQYNRFYANLGNHGSASYPLLFNLQTEPNFRFKPDVYDPYKLKDDSIKIFVCDNPFSHVRYYMGPAKEQKLEFNFGQRIGTGIYLGLNARFANAPGIYLRQRAYHAGGTFYGAFLYPTQRYGAIVTFRTDHSTHYENGGLNDINDFLLNRESNRKVINTNLSDASNIGKSNGLVIQQYFNILKPKIEKKTDSATLLVPRKFDAGRIIYTMRYSRNADSYLDKLPPANFYPDYYNDTIQVYDSTRITHFENCFVYSNEVPDTLGKSFPLQYSFGIRLQTDKLVRDTIYTDVFRHMIPFGMLKGIIKQKTFFKASGFLVLGGYKAGDYSLNGSFYQFFGKLNQKIYLNVSKGLIHPDFYFNSYITENFKWNYSFKGQNFLKGEIGVILKGFDLSASYTRISDYIYLNQNVLPASYNNALHILAGQANKEFRVKHWIANVYATFQQITPDSIIQLPAFIGKISICYDANLFKNALHAQIGLSCTYHSKWYQDSYMPSLKAFYRQDSYESGNYPYMDAFINLNIKRARLFLKYEHFNAGLTGYNYILVPDYPQADAAFKFGVSWLFFD